MLATRVRVNTTAALLVVEARVNTTAAMLAMRVRANTMPSVLNRSIMPNNQRQRRICYALCHILYPMSAANTSLFCLFWMDLNFKFLRRC